jgi:hypothetical protein
VGMTVAPVGQSFEQPWATLACLICAEDLHTHFPPGLRSLPITLPSSDLPSGVPWFTLSLAPLDETERLVVLDPIAFLEQNQERYDRDIHGYTCKFCKHEVVARKQRDEEIIEAFFREEPFSVLFKWEKGAGAFDPKRTLYVAGENDNKLVVPVLGGRMSVDPEGGPAKARARYAMTQFGMRKAMQQVIDSWRQSQTANISLSVKYYGKREPPGDGKLLPLKDRLAALDRGRPVGKSGTDSDQLCYTLLSTRGEAEGPDHVVHAILYVSLKDRVLVRTELFEENGKPIAVYHFKDVKFNPKFEAEQFRPEIVDKK